MFRLKLIHVSKGGPKCPLSLLFCIQYDGLCSNKFVPNDAGHIVGIYSFEKPLISQTINRSWSTFLGNHIMLTVIYLYMYIFFTYKNIIYIYDSHLKVSLPNYSPTTHPWREGMGCLLWLQCIINVTTRSMLCGVGKIILDLVIMKLHCLMGNSQRGRF